MSKLEVEIMSMSGLAPDRTTEPCLMRPGSQAQTGTRSRMIFAVQLTSKSRIGNYTRLMSNLLNVCFLLFCFFYQRSSTNNKSIIYCTVLDWTVLYCTVLYAMWTSNLL